MAERKYISETIPALPEADDRLLVADTSNSNDPLNSSVSEVVKSGMSDNTSDDLPQGSTNLYLTPTEKAKLTGIQLGAQVNAVFSVNGDIGNVLLTQDDVPDGTLYIRTQNNFTDTKENQLATAYTHSTLTSTNPHNVTKTEIGLGDVLNKEQLTKEPNDWSFATETALAQLDKFLIEDSNDLFAKKVIEFKDIITSFMSSTTQWIKNSIIQSGGMLELDGDEDTPPEGYAYMNHKGVKGRHTPLVRYIFDSNEDIHIPTGHQMIVQGGIIGGQNITGGGVLVIIN